MTDDALDQWLTHVAAGEALPNEVIRSLAAGRDFLQLGMLADATRQHWHGTAATFLRVALWTETQPATEIGSGARELRMAAARSPLPSALPSTLPDAIAALEVASAIGGGRAISAFSWSDVERWSAEAEGTAAVLAQLKRAGLTAVATMPIDDGLDVDRVVGQLVDAGFSEIRMHVAHAATHDRVDLWQQVAAAHRRTGAIRSVNPLPSAVKAGWHTTGYDDVKMVAVARLAVGGVPSVQLDWTRYGPKLAQVALTVGVDDLDNVSASDAAPEGRRRAPLDEVRRNILSAGFQPVERDGWFRAVVS